MNTKDILKPLTREQLATLSKTDLIALYLGEQDLRNQAEGWARVCEEETYRIGDLYVRLKKRFFAKKSERSPKPNGGSGKAKKSKKKAENRKLLPSERYPSAPVLEQDVEIVPPPPCGACGHQMCDSGMTETTEVLTVIPKQFLIKRQHHHKYRCPCCHGDLKTTPPVPRIKAGSAYDDAMIIDVAMSKYCDLIPIERYCQMAKRDGFGGLPPQSLIELTHYLADFLEPIYHLIRAEILEAEIIFADETPHRMLEGDKRSNWFLWGFTAAEGSCYFECHDTRSGDIASDILLAAKCRYLVSDVYAGYHKATTLCNAQRQEAGLLPLENVFCNAHARRKFREIGEGSKVADYYVGEYKEIYRLDGDLQKKSPEERLEGRLQMKNRFAAMRSAGESFLDGVSSKSSDAQAINYFLKNFDGLTRFLTNPSLPIDNNLQERLLRNHVVGRKTWYGTHSHRGAETAAKLFSIIESCKLNKLNPRSYVQQLVKDLHHNKIPYTPRQAAKIETERNTC